MKLEARPYQPVDLQALSQMLHETIVQGNSDDQGLGQRLVAIQARGGLIWTLCLEDLVAGYALVDPIPGLGGIYDLQGCIASQHRRQGLATYLLGRILADLKRSAVDQISHPVNSLESGAARFLLSQGFFSEHREWQMSLNDMARLSSIRMPVGFQLQTIPRSVAISHFRRLYQKSFADTPWYQPYLSDQEVAVELADPADLIFLKHDGQLVGFAWLRWPEVHEAEIEPIGLVSAYQGRGLGRPFLAAVLSQAAQQGARRFTLGVWVDNKSAIHLYQKIGFVPFSTTTYLAYNVEHDPQMIR